MCLHSFSKSDLFHPATARRILQSACSEIHAELAFIWISFVVSTIIVLHLFRVGTQAHKRIGRVVSREAFQAPHLSDPFLLCPHDRPGARILPPWITLQRAVSILLPIRQAPCLDPALASSVRRMTRIRIASKKSGTGNDRGPYQKRGEGTE